ncbi:MAG: hypothetical protein ACE5HT_10970 [Gemmatimonadales bacterium]
MKGHTSTVEIHPLELKVGQRILYGRYTGMEITLDDDQYLIIKESDVLAVLEDAPG